MINREDMLELTRRMTPRGTGKLLCMESLAEQGFYLTSERIITILKTKGEKRRRRQ